MKHTLLKLLIASLVGITSTTAQSFIGSDLVSLDANYAYVNKGLPFHMVGSELYLQKSLIGSPQIVIDGGVVTSLTQNTDEDYGYKSKTLGARMSFASNIGSTKVFVAPSAYKTWQTTSYAGMTSRTNASAWSVSVGSELPICMNFITTTSIRYDKVPSWNEHMLTYSIYADYILGKNTMLGGYVQYIGQDNANAKRIGMRLTRKL